MFTEEALWIKSVLDEVAIDSATKILDVGASDIEYRTSTQPHINENIHKPLLEKGATFSFLDIKDHEGVDIVMDLAAKDLPDDLFKVTYDLIICCNILEHIVERNVFMQNLLRFTHPGTLLMVTVPLVYPKHNDPIDTMFRPTVRELVNFIGSYVKYKIIKSNEIEITEKAYYVFKPGRILDYLLLRSPRWLIRWYIKPLRWKQTCVLLEVLKG
ncbi:MAG: hypothetical protein HOP23_03190 [Methylococcaceae bacterium]|nr:hypothetical protein [Methylococcaceae bacterium]